MPDQLEQLRSQLAGRYTIERELGRGGTAIVYLAHDVKHDRKVALKLLNPELALAVRVERFLREIQIAARLTHPHILALYDSGQAGGSGGGRSDNLYYVMPFVEGETLRDRLTRERQLPLEDALAIARDVAEALGYAHAQGVVHRDIKPENILLHEGHAVVMDFGIARALTVASQEGVTESGIVVGTPAYMSPEQANPSLGAGPGIDARSDLYSLGCVLYEMLVGHPPFHGTTAQEVLSRHAMDPVPSMRAAHRSLPQAVERATQKALAKSPADRFASAAQFADALRSGSPGHRAPRGARVLLYAAAVPLIIAGSWLALARSGNTLEPAPKSLAVLPFDNLSTDPGNDYFSEGVTEELINTLTRFPSLHVIARTSAFAFKEKTDVDVQEIGRALQVGHVVQGSVRRDRGHLRVAARG